MAAYKIPSDQLEKFRTSVHGVALFVDQHPLAPTCATCHGSHGASDVQGITAACGHCHSRTLEYFNESPHRKAVQDGKMSECVSCHGYHDTPAPNLTLLDTTCPACHAADSQGFATAQKLKAMLTQAQQSLETANLELVQIERIAPTAVRFRPRLQQARANYLEALPVQHALRVERVDDLTRSARSISEDVRSAIHGIEQDRRLSLLWLAVVWVYVLFTAGVAYLYRRERRQQGTQPGRH
jgi:Zn finger protein HypA/HybF involved in hydrogenase expression